MIVVRFPTALDSPDLLYEIEVQVSPEAARVEPHLLCSAVVPHAVPHTADQSARV